MRTGHLFAGAGGGLLADRILGHRPVFAVEWDRYCCEVLRERSADGWFPDLRVHEGDVRLWDPSEYAGCVDSLHAGFPCQDISVAGAGAGIDGDKSGLWSEVVRVAGILRPRELFLENSPAIVTQGLDRVLSDLASLGYDAKWICLSAARVGAPHIRDRWWCLASNTYQHGKPVIAQHDEASGVPSTTFNPSSIRRTENGSREPDAYGEEMADSTDVGLQGTKQQRQPKPIGKWTGNAGWWEFEPDVGRVASKLASRVDRLKALGNGQVPLQAALAYRLLKGEV